MNDIKRVKQNTLIAGAEGFFERTSSWAVSKIEVKKHNITMNKISRPAHFQDKHVNNILTINI